MVLGGFLAACLVDGHCTSCAWQRTAVLPIWTISSFPSGGRSGSARPGGTARPANEASGFGMLLPSSATALIPKESWRQRLKPQKQLLGVCSIEAYACLDQLPRPPGSSEHSALAAAAARMDLDSPAAKAMAAGKAPHLATEAASQGASQISHEASESFADASSGDKALPRSTSVPSQDKTAAMQSPQQGVRQLPTLKGPARALLGPDPALAVRLQMACGPAGPHCPPRPLLAFKPPPPLNPRHASHPTAGFRPPPERPPLTKPATSKPSLSIELPSFLKWGRRMPRSPGGGHCQQDKPGASGGIQLNPTANDTKALEPPIRSFTTTRRS
ncbi:hypothetical protein WJX84_009790 [Apatococcus fuscideae]|uniref:Uncharacterized protein n=1 Tax=Apatococcus fuscideae TaxID=2026836 RepID=A0AAW1RV36_9CHLO